MDKKTYYKKLQQQRIAQKQREAEERAERLKKQSTVFKRWPGKALRWVAIVAVAYTATLLIDTFLPYSYTKYEDHGATSSTIRVVSAHGWYVPATFYKVKLRKDGKLTLLMYKREYELVETSGSVEVGRSPIYQVPQEYRAIHDRKGIARPINRSMVHYRFLPIAILLFAGCWLLIKPDRSFQTVIFGYICMLVIPILLVISLSEISTNFSENADLEIDMRYWDWPD